jgi:hypothetical protein
VGRGFDSLRAGQFLNPLMPRIALTNYAVGTGADLTRRIHG